MFKNYVKTALRTLSKNKGFTAINVLGLALGITTCLLIVFYVFDELSYDRFNEKADRIFRLTDDIKFGGTANSYAVSPAAAAAELKNDFPEVEETLRFRARGGAQVKKGNKNIQEYAMIYADPTLFDLFTLPMIHGNPATALTEPHTVVITERIAIKYFNSSNVLGKFLTFDDTALYKITGVIKDIPVQSHFNFDFFMSMATLNESRDVSWFANNFNTYILLKPDADYKKLQAKLPVFLRNEAGPQLQSVLHLSFDAFEQSGNYYRIHLTPLKKIHLESNSVAELGYNGNIQYVYIFSAIALFILLIACANFMNLSTARSANRAREVGVRKVLGVQRKYLIAQFLTESLILTLGAAIIAVFASWALLPLFNQLSGKELTLTPQIFGWLLPILLGFVLIIGCLAGSYPAFFLSAFQPIDVLKGKIASGFKSSSLRSFLVVFQFAISIFLIIGTLVIYGQLKYIQTKDLGYNRYHVLIVNNVWTLGDKASAFKEEVKQLTGVERASLAEALPTWDYGNGTTLFKDQMADQQRALGTQLWGVDNDYLPTLGIKMAAGRNFSSQMLTDSTGLIINEAAARLLDFPDPLNQTLYWPQDNLGKTMKALHIIGVMKDFNFKSLRQNVTPIAFRLDNRNASFCMHIQSSNIPGLLSQIKSKWKAFSSGQEFGYSFMDDDFNNLYRSEQRIGQIFLIFTSLAIIIACLGLFGLSAYAAEQRTKEIGIRKLLGASMTAIVSLLSKDFVKLILIAILIASPLAWLVMRKWLEGFAYRQNIRSMDLVLAGLGSIIIAFLTISFQSIKVALTNPAKSLKSE